MDELGTVASLWRFPVKSMQGEELDAVDVSEAGLAGDRAYALIDEGNVVSAKRPSRWERLMSCVASFVDEPEPASPPPPVRIELDDGTVLRSDDRGVHERLSKIFGRDVHLEAHAPEGATIEEIWSPAKGDEPYGAAHAEGSDTYTEYPASFAAPEGTFFDFSALHLLTTSTLEAFRKAHPDERVDVRRFRPNVVIETATDGFVENDWRNDLTLGAVGAKPIIPTPRCVMTTLSQPGLDRDPEVLRTLAETNRIRAGGLGELPCAGIYAAVTGAGTVRRGDPVRVG